MALWRTRSIYNKRRLVKMESEARSLAFLSEAGMVEIPFFQREYVWKKNNWEDLLNDLWHVEKSHFLGSLILKQQKTKTGDPKKVLVIDGQQRLTTLTILLKALYDLFDKEIKESVHSDILKVLFVKKKATDKNYYHKIKHSVNDEKAYKQVIGEATNSSITPFDGTLRDAIVIDDPDVKPPVVSNDSRIFQCYKYFYEELKNHSDDERADLFNYLMNQDNKILVVIDLDADDNEQEIFDTINSADVRLSSTDIIKNAIFQQIIEKYSEQEAIDYHNKLWTKTFSDNGAKLYWEQKKATGRLFRDNSEILMQTVAIIEGLYDPDSNSLSDLADCFKKKVFACGAKEIVDLLNTICDYAIVYKESIPEISSETSFEYNDNLLRIIHLCLCMGITTFHPYIIFLVKKYEDGLDTRDAKLFLLEQYLVKVLITNASKKNFNKECMDFIKAEKNNDDSVINGRINSIKTDQISKGLKYIYNAPATYLLFWIELFRRENDSKQAMKELHYNYTLEHILPQKWEANWKTVDVYDEDCKTIISDVDKAKKFRYERLYSIGNMTLLSGPLNSSVSNYDFERKINGVPKQGRKREKKGMRDYNELSLAKEIIEPYNNGDKIWDERKIIPREKKLHDEIVKIWKL